MVFRLLLVLILILILPLLTYFRVTIQASLRSGDQDHWFNINIASTLGIIKEDHCFRFEDILSRLSGFKVDNDRIFLTTRLIKLPQQISKKIHTLKNDLSLTSGILRWLVIEKLEWKTRAGSDDAMNTAILTGFLWSFKGSVISVISSRTRLQKLILNNEPDFNKPGINSCVLCILKIRIVHIIIIASLIFALKVRGYLHGYSK